jgi:pimeloyl-ACP methyl ester carboxylesterase
MDYRPELIVRARRTRESLMTIVLVHGNPETEAIWDDLRPHLGRQDVVALSPPGFGAHLPDGFGANSDDYVAWLKSALEHIARPIDLVGHDWGGGHVMRLANILPERIRSWTIDIAGCFDADYVWHDLAQIWQTPGAGETAIEQAIARPLIERVKRFESLGMSKAVAERVAPAMDEVMGRCILTLYRSAAQPQMKEWGSDLSKARTRPGLVLIPTEDQYTGGEAAARRTAERTGARVAVLHGLGHWWMCQDPKRGAQVVREFVASLG